MLKLYIWKNLESLKVYSNGMAAAYEEPLDRAIDLILFAYYAEHGKSDWEKTRNALDVELHSKTPEIHERPFAYYQHGSF